jgi:ABC-type multidrug transport system permease subunit
MNPLLPLFKRELLEFKKHVFPILLFWVLMPIIIHTLLAIPLSRLITMDIRYLNWSAAGIWITAAGMTAFLQSASRMRKIQFESQQIDALLKSPISNLDLITINIARGMMYGFGQFIVAILITSTLNHEYLSLGSFLILFIQMITLILHFSVLGTFVGILVSNGILFVNISFILFLAVTMGFGNFIPLKYYPPSFLSVINTIPTTTAFENVRSVILHNPFNWAGFLLTLLGTIFIGIITLIISHKIFRKL